MNKPEVVHGICFNFFQIKITRGYVHYVTVHAELQHKISYANRTFYAAHIFLTMSLLIKI